MEYLAICICLFLSAFFSGAEIAFFSISDTRLHTLADENRKSAKLALRLRSNPQRLLSTILIGNNLVNFFAVSMVSIIAFQLFGPGAVAVATTVLALFVILFGEIVPKTLCAKYAESVVPVIAFPVFWLEKLFSPFLYLLEPLILKLTGGRGLSIPVATEEELKIMLEAGGKAGVLETDEVKMIKNVFEFTDLTAEDVMTPRIYMFGLEGNLHLEEAKEELFKSKYSRIPVYDENLDKITGILYRNQALKDLAQGNVSVALKDIARPALFIPGAKPCDDLLKQFQKEKRHIAIVVNEFGGVIGLATTEDLLEEVVGEILDETDLSEELIKRIGKNQIIVSGRTEIRRINEFFKVELDDELNTISGLIQQELGHIPVIGEEVRADHCRLIVRDADERSIKSVQILKIEESSPEISEPEVGTMPG